MNWLACAWTRGRNNWVYTFRNAHREATTLCISYTFHLTTIASANQVSGWREVSITTFSLCIL